MRDILPRVNLKLAASPSSVLLHRRLREVRLQTSLILVRLFVVYPTFSHESIDGRQGANFGRTYLSLRQVGQFFLSQSESNLLDIILKNVSVLLCLLRRNRLSVDHKMTVVNDDLLSPLRGLLTLESRILSSRIVATSKHGLKERLVRERFNTLYFARVFSLAKLGRPILFFDSALVGESPFEIVGVLQGVLYGNRRLLIMQIEVLFLLLDETCRVFPFSLVVKFYLTSLLVVVNQGESQAEMVFRVGKEMFLVIGDVLAELLLLELPNVELLAAVAVDLNSLG